MSEKKSYSVIILGNSYRLVSDEDPSHVTKVGSLVDAVMRSIQKAGVTDEARIAVLAALQIASKTVQLERIIEQYDAAEQAITQQIDAVLAASSPGAFSDEVRPAVDGQ